MSIEAMKQALQYIEANADSKDEWDMVAALRQAIEQAEKQRHEFVCGECVKCGASIEKREWVELTDEEIRKLAKENIYVLNAIIATTAKLRSKNT